MSVLGFDQETNQIQTISLHYYQVFNPTNQFLVLDDSSSTVALFFNNSVSILNLRSKVPSFVIDLKKKHGIENIVDAVFLNGYIQPTLAVLYEPIQTNTCRLAERRDTQCITVLSIDIGGNVVEDIMEGKKNSSVLYQRQGLPYNGYALIKVPYPTDQLSSVVAAVNAYWAWEHTPEDKNPIYSKEIFSDFISLGLNLDNSYSWFVNPDTLILCNRSGELIEVELIGKEGVGSNWSRKKAGVKKILVKRLGINAVQPTSSCSIDMDFNDKNFNFSQPQYLFLGSTVSDSILIKIKHTLKETIEDVKKENLYNEEQDEEMDDLYLYQKESTDNNQLTATKFKLQICDTITNLSPLRSTVTSLPAQYSEDFTYKNILDFQDLELVSCCGEGKSGNLLVLHQNIRPLILSSFDFQDIMDMWNIRISKHRVLTRNLMGENETNQLEYHKFLILGKEDSTMVIETGDEFEELESGDFNLSEGTIFCGTVLKDTHLVQVYSSGMILLDSDAHSKDKVKFFEDTKNDIPAIFSTICDPFILIHFSDGSLEIYFVQDISIIFKKYVKLKNGNITASNLFSEVLGQNFIKIHDGVNTNLENNVFKTPATPSKKNYTSKLKSNQTGDTTNHSTLKIIPAKRDFAVFGSGEEDLYSSEQEIDQEKNVEVVAWSEREDKMEIESPPEETISEVVYLIEYDILKEDDCNFDDLNDTQYFLYFINGNGDFEVNVQLNYFILLTGNVFQIDFLINYHEEKQCNSEPELNLKNKSKAINEILISNFGKNYDCLQLYLFMVNEVGDLIIYQGFNNPSNNSNSISLRFLKFNHQHLSRDVKLNGKEISVANNSVLSREGSELATAILEREDGSTPKNRKKSYFKIFRGLGGDGEFNEKEVNEEDEILKSNQMQYNGIFFCGPKPCFIMFSGASNVPYDQFDSAFVEGEMDLGLNLLDATLKVHGNSYLRIHPFFKDDEVISFAEFNNTNCRRGFMYLNKQGNLRICNLLQQFSYHLEAPFVKVNLGRTPLKISYHYESFKHVLATSTPVDFNLEKAKYAAALSAGVIDVNDEDAKPKPNDNDSGKYYPEIGSYALELVSPVTWETVDIHKMEEYEMILCVESVLLESKQTESGSKLFLAVGTGFFRGEDLATRGRILIYDVVEVVPQIDNPQTNHKLKLLYVSDEKSPVTALSSINGFLIASIGSKVIIHSFDNSEKLTGVAFLDVNLYVTSLMEIPPKVTLIGKDYYPLSVYSLNCIVNENEMSFVVADGEKNLQVIQYNPYNISSIGGAKLLRRGDIHVGSQVQSVLRLRSLLPEGLSRQHFNVCASLDGRISAIIPVDEKVYRRLYAVYSRMVNQIQHLAGLNPRGFRQAQLKVKPLVSNLLTGPPGAKGVLDGDLLCTFFNLSIKMREELTQGTQGVNSEQVLDDIREILQRMDYF
ncbi:Cleavage and polyadenylation specificity factor subunit 1 [Clydaea vesicula]|uniref:Cleavage and polyadenylation specificity factor subunit 1 n=1 Tax=Clydaea vesicula TaxID=447962 RepID=A0AAD5XVV4_9FUNG|nr:Cleavage and polyadenylation specificity factor subunit 1 [Clydaea vesicula]